jgi:hypothetical protein
MSARDHIEIEELLALRALDGLDAQDAARLEVAMAEHGECVECRDIERGFTEAAAFLAGSLDPDPVTPDAFDRLIGATRTREPAAVDELAMRRARRRLPTWLAAAAALLVLIGSVALLRSGGVQTDTDWGARIVRFEGGEGELAMAFVPGEPGVAFWGRNLPDPGAGRVYEIWMIEGDSPVSGGCVTPVDGRVAFFVDTDVGTADLMAVTVESPSCPDAPTGDPVLTAPLS